MHYISNQTECTLKMLTISSNLLVRERQALCVSAFVCVCIFKVKKRRKLGGEAEYGGTALYKLKEPWHNVTCLQRL